MSAPTYVSDLPSLGRFIRAQRHDLGLTQGQLGERLEWPQERVSLLETGHYGTPSLRSLAILAHALAVSRADLLVALHFLDYLPRHGPGQPPVVDGVTAVVETESSPSSPTNTRGRERQRQRKVSHHARS